MWDFCIHLLASVIDKYAQHHSEQKGLKTNALPGLLMYCCVKYIKEISKKKKAASTNDPLIWKQFKDAIARNKANNSVKKF